MEPTNTLSLCAPLEGQYRGTALPVRGPTTDRPLTNGIRNPCFGHDHVFAISLSRFGPATSRYTSASALVDSCENNYSAGPGATRRLSQSTRGGGNTHSALQSARGASMKAVRLHREGGPEQLVYEDAPEPVLGAGDALIRVHATGITPAELTWADTYRNCDGSERLPAIPGHEVSGVVESVAHGVSDVSIGDEVYALTSFCRDGAAAEYVAVHAADLAPKPKTLDRVQAAAVPLSALTVWQAFFDHARLAPGQRVLIHGAAGGVGSFAVQIAHWHGAYAVGTASAGKPRLPARPWGE